LPMNPVAPVTKYRMVFLLGLGYAPRGAPGILVHLPGRRRTR